MQRRTRDPGVFRAEDSGIAMDPIHISVTELCCASSDAQWRERWLQGKEQVLKPRGAADVVVVYGTQFHAFARKLVAQLVKHRDVPNTAQPDALLRELHTCGAAAFLDEL